MFKTFTLLLFGLIYLNVHSQVTDTLFQENFESAPYSFTLNSGDVNGVGGTNGLNHWVIDNFFVGGSYGYICFGAWIRLVPQTNNQPAWVTNGPNSTYMHIRIGNKYGGTLNAAYHPAESPAGNPCDTAESYFSKMTTPISTLNYSNVKFEFTYMVGGSAWAQGEIWYSTDQGASWDFIRSFTGTGNWTTFDTTNVAFDNKVNLQFGFRFLDGIHPNVTNYNQASFGIDEIFISGNPSGCTSPTAAFTDTSTAYTTTFTNTSSTNGVNESWLWDFGDGNTSTQKNPVHVYASTGAYNVCLIATDSCASDTICDTVNIICPDPVADFTYFGNLLNYSFTDNSTGSNISSYLWDFGDGTTSTLQNPFKQYSTSGTYTVCLTVTDVCNTDSSCQTITVVCPKPDAGFSYADNFLQVNFTDTSVGTSINSWRWDFGDGGMSFLKNPSHTYNAAGNYTVCLIVTDQCGKDTVCTEITVNCAGPSGNFSWVTNNLSVNFTDLSTGTNISSWAWDFGDGATSTLQNPSHTFANAGFHTVCLIVTDKCGTDTICQAVGLNCPPPEAKFNWTTSYRNVSFSDISNATNISSWTWDFGDGNTSNLQNPVHSYASAGTYLTCLTIVDSCGNDSVCNYVNVRCDDPEAGFSWTSNFLTLSFTDTSSGNSISGWSWDFGDGTTSTLQNPQHTFVNAGTFNVCLTVTDTCGSNRVCTLIVVNCEGPQVGFSWSDNNLTVNFTDTSKGANIQSWLWDFGDGTPGTQQNPTHIYTAPGNYYVCLQVTDTCGTNFFCQTITVTCPKPDAGFSWNSSFKTISFTDTSTGVNIQSWSWDFGDGNTSNLKDPVHTYASEGNYTVCLIIKDDCGADTTCQVIGASCPPPVAGFNYSGNLLNYSFTDKSAGNFISSWLWDFGDGSTSNLQNPNHTYNTGGFYTVCLTISDTCGTDSVCQTVSVNCPAPVSSFTWNTNLLSTSFLDASNGNGITSWLWDFGDGNTSNLQNPSHTYAAAGSYTVCLTISDSCGTDSICNTVTVSCPDPVADYTWTANQLDVTFNNLSTGSGTMGSSWDFGDGNNSTQQNPSHTYASQGSYQVCLTITDTCGTNTFCDSVDVIGTGLTVIDDQISFNLFPNPTSGNLFIQWETDNIEPVEIRIMDISGKEVMSIRTFTGNGKTDKINTANLPKGAYFIRLKNDNWLITEKVIVQ
jgi:PKD repeat protein